jgi:hypothetical protein
MRIYPGNNSSVQALAEYCGAVALDRGLPQVLPVMASVPELTAAWTSEGNLEDVPGYLDNVDACSVGLWQQQADDLGCGEFGWGLREELIQVPFALGRFLDVALEMSGGERHKGATDPAILGEWCADVQRPLESLRYKYEKIGYPLAVQLLGEPGVVVDEWPQVAFSATAQAWAYLAGTQKFLRGPAGGTWKTDANGWLYLESGSGKDEPEPVDPEEPGSSWSWPETWDEPDPSSWNYEARHPTRYTWRADVEPIARAVVDGWPEVAWCNSYWDHPENYWRTLSSFDVWDYSGRNGWLDGAAGDEIFNWLWNLDWGPDIEWIIYKRHIYGAWNGWAGEFFGDGSQFTNHEDHIHVTYLGSG